MWRGTTRRYFARTITLDTFLNYFSDSEDPLIRALVDAVVHEPGRGGFLGLRDRGGNPGTGSRWIDRLRLYRTRKMR